MAQEEQTQRCSNSRGDNSSNISSKKLKQKVPQRGLGVAQLEKIRLEEQQNKDVVAILSPNSLLSPTNSSCLAAPFAPNFRHNPSPSSIPLPPPLPTDLCLPNSIFRPESSIPSIDFLHQNFGPFSKPLNGDERQGNLPKLWNGDYNLERENHRSDHNGFTFRSNVNLPNESDPIWPSPSVVQRAHQFQQQPSVSLSMVNVSSGTSSSSSSVINCHRMEPPSNQSFYGNNNSNAPMWLEEEKMVGRKRPHALSLDNPPGLSFPYKIPLINRSGEPSCGNGGSANVEVTNPIFREGPSSSSLLSELNNPNKVAEENGDLNGDFLTLAPPTTTEPHSRSKYKHPSVYLMPHSRELPDFKSLPFQGSVESPIDRPGPSGSAQQKPLYGFFPLATAQMGRAATVVGSRSSGVRENLDLNLKL